MGRKSRAELRREEILAAFERLIAREGLDVPLERVADEAGLQRSLIRHYLGNREELVEQLMARVAEAYPQRIAEELAAAEGGGAGAMLDMFFSSSSETAAWDDIILAVVNSSQGRYPAAKRHVLAMAEAIVASLAEAIGRIFPAAPPAARYEAAYSIVCIVQTDYTLRCLGLDPAHGALARAGAERLLAGLAAPDQR